MATKIDETCVYSYTVVGNKDKVLKRSKTMDEALEYVKANKTKSKGILEERKTTTITTESYYAWIKPTLKNKHID